MNLLFMHRLALFMHRLCIKKILKMGFMILFTQLKIILLPYFQFSVFNFQFSATINSIQTDPLCFYAHVLLIMCLTLLYLFFFGLGHFQ